MFGLTPHAIAMISQTLGAHPQVDRALLFGSRAMGNYRDNSDIDLCLHGKIDEKLLARIAAELEELPLPYRFDLVLYDAISHPPVKDHIDRLGQNFPITRGHVPAGKKPRAFHPRRR